MVCCTKSNVLSSIVMRPGTIWLFYECHSHHHLDNTTPRTLLLCGTAAVRFIAQHAYPCTICSLLPTNHIFIAVGIVLHCMEGTIQLLNQPPHRHHLSSAARQWLLLCVWIDTVVSIAAVRYILGSRIIRIIVAHRQTPHSSKLALWGCYKRYQIPERTHRGHGWWYLKGGVMPATGSGEWAWVVDTVTEIPWWKMFVVRERKENENGGAVANGYFLKFRGESW